MFAIIKYLPRYTFVTKKIDNKMRVCFMTATYTNYEALRAAFPTIEIECYIQKPVATKDLVRRINAELE
jgi:response regulator RpfG family c-di-GMP phosphodiesterase